MSAFDDHVRLKNRPFCNWFATHHEWIPFLAAVSIRLLCLCDFLGSPFFLPLGGDRGLYHRAALAVYQGNGLPEVFLFTPLYPYVIGWFYRIIGGPNLAAVAILQALLDGLTALLISALARRWYGALAGTLAGLGFAIFGLAVAYSLVTMPVSLGLFWTALTATCVDLWQHRWNHVRAIMLGLLLGIGGQILGAFWLMLIPFSFWIILGSCSPLRQRLIMGMLVILFGAACLLPTLVHNVIPLPSLERSVQADGRQWIPVTAHGGLNVYMGNNPASEGYGTAIPGLRINAEEMTRDSIALASRLNGKSLSPAEADRYWKRQAWDFWRKDSAQAFNLLIKKIHRLISIGDFDDTGISRLFPESVRGLRITVVSFGLVWLLACAGYGLRPTQRRNPGLWIIAICFALGIAMTFVTARYRLPLAVLLLPAAGATLAALPAVLQNARHGINLRWAAGILGMGFAIVPHTMPDTLLVDDLNRSNHWGQYGDAQKAVSYALRAVFQRRDSPEAWFVLGNAYWSQGNYVSALDAYSRVMILQPDRTDAIFNAGRSLERLGNADDARFLFEHIVELDPRHAKAWFSIAVLNRNADDIEGAHDAVAEASGIVGWNHPDIVTFRQSKSFLP